MTFNKTAKIVTLTAFTLLFGTPNTDANGSGSTTFGKSVVKTSVKTFDWNPVMDAITQVESEGDSNARCGKYLGAMQIAPILVKECNNILETRGDKKRYTLKDRLSEEKSREMFVLIQSKYNPENDVERAIRLWNGGVRYTTKTTQRYYNKVMAELNK